MRRAQFIILAAVLVLIATGMGYRSVALNPQVSSPAGTALGLPAQAAHIPNVEKPAAIMNFGKVPVYFIPNSGQMDGKVDFYIQGKDKAVYFTPEGVTFALSYGAKPKNEMKDLAAPGKRPRLKGDDSGHGPAVRDKASGETKRWAVKMDFVDARKDAKPEGVEKTGAVISYFKGKPEDWHEGLAAYSKIIYRDLWPGIDLVYKGDIDKLKYEYVVHPGADPAAIRIALRGAEIAQIDEAGRLEIITPAGSFEDKTPLAYQDIGGERTEVPMAFELAETEVSQSYSAEAKSYIYGFEVGAYDITRELVLDPETFFYCGYIGGSSLDIAFGIALDGTGNAYITGATSSTQATFPVTAGPDLTYNDLGSNYDAFVAKVNSSGTALVYCGYIGGSSEDLGDCIAIDSSGNAYVGGYTYSSQATFPVTVGPDLTNNGDMDGFVAKINSAGTALVYCGYIGGRFGDDYVGGIAVDGSGNVFLAGFAGSDQAAFPVTVGPDLTYNGGNGDAFVAKLNPAGTAFIYCGYIGGSAEDVGYCLAIDGSGNAYVSGWTHSSTATFPVTVGPDLTYNGKNDTYVAKVNASGTALIYCGYIGGSGDDLGWNIAVDGTGNAYVTGWTSSAEATFPATVGPDLTYNGDQDAFVAKVNTTGSSLVYCGYIGGSGDDDGWGIAVDSAGNAYVSGVAHSDQATFPVTVGPDLTFNGSTSDAFVAKVDTTGTSLVYCGYLGGSDGDFASAAAVDGAGNAYVTGATLSSQSTFPVAVGPDLTYNDGVDAFVAKITKGYYLTVAAGTGGTTNPVPGAYLYAESKSAGVQAVAAAAYVFDSWSGDGSGSANPATIVMSADKSIRANFARAVKPPINLTGEKLMNRSVAMIEYVVRLKWQVNTANTETINYRVYRIENGQATAIANVNSGTTTYMIRGLQKSTAYRFGVTAVNSVGWESDMVEVVVQ